MRAGLSQEELADKAGIHVTYLSGIERGLRNPSILNINRLAQAIELPIKELFLFIEEA
jgi:transcriptional regulator with XRE-family HTH domain